MSFARGRDRRELSGRRALVTGASGGIGAATARLLDRRGARVAVHGRDAAALAAVAGGLQDAVAITADLAPPPRAPDLLSADLLSPDLLSPGLAAADVVARAAGGLGGLDIVVSNAGAGWAGPFGSMTAAEIDTVLDLNLRAAVHLVHAALPHLRNGRDAHIVLVGSIAGLLPVGGEAVYSASKAGLAALGEALRPELRPTGVAVSVVSPGVVDTPFFARRNRPYDRRRPRPIPASEVADAIVDCLDHDRAGRGRVVPAWLGAPVRLRGAAPGMYRALADRFG